jgi:hypothetical protein
VTSAEVAEWLDTFTDDHDPDMTGEIEKFNRLVDSGDGNRHHAMIRGLMSSLWRACRGCSRRGGRRAVAGGMAHGDRDDSGHCEADFDEMLSWSIAAIEAE